MSIESPETTADPAMPSDPPDVFYYSPRRYLWVMLAIAWSAFAHPFSTTVIDIRTGEMQHYSNQGDS